MHRLYRRFRVALRDRDAAALRALVRDHPEAHADCARGGAPVRRIAASGLDLLRAAFEAGLHPDADDEPSPAQTFLQQLAADGDVAAVALCLDFGADVERRNHRGETALGYACSWGHLAVVKRLVEAGAAIDAVEHDPEDGVRNTALDSATSHPEIVEYLRSVGARRITELDDA
jgi:ankyrin repeat protein